VIVYDTTTGKVIEKRTAQGYQAESTWLRGQAWGVYGFTMCFRETKDTTYLNTAVKMADYFINHLPSDYIAYWRLNLPEDHPKKFRDASAAAIFFSGVLELRNYVKNPEKYDHVINKIMDTIIMNYLSEGIHSSGILTHCAYNVNSANPDDRDASTIWGDYYFLEAIKRYKNVKQK
jgi:unsaturated chondroitin disaccharide hydrolase